MQNRQPWAAGTECRWGRLQSQEQEGEAPGGQPEEPIFSLDMFSHGMGRSRTAAFAENFPVMDLSSATWSIEMVVGHEHS